MLHSAWQCSPPLTGRGESQVLTLSFVPPPQLREHRDQGVQAPQEPSTGSCLLCVFVFSGQNRSTVGLLSVITLLELYWEPSDRETVCPQLKTKRRQRGFWIFKKMSTYPHFPRFSGLQSVQIEILLNKIKKIIINGTNRKISNLTLNNSLNASACITMPHGF